MISRVPELLVDLLITLGLFAAGFGVLSLLVALRRYSVVQALLDAWVRWEEIAEVFYRHRWEASLIERAWFRLRPGRGRRSAR